MKKNNRKSKVDEQILHTRARKRIWCGGNKNRSNKIKMSFKTTRNYRCNKKWRIPCTFNK